MSYLEGATVASAQAEIAQPHVLVWEFRHTTIESVFSHSSYTKETTLDVSICVIIDRFINVIEFSFERGHFTDEIIKFDCADGDVTFIVGNKKLTFDRKDGIYSVIYSDHDETVTSQLTGYDITVMRKLLFHIA